MRLERVEERFWAKVDKNGPVPARSPEAGPCWLWTGAHHKSGYGFFWLDGRNVGAHRFSLETKLGRPLAPGMQARHVVCDNPPCVNPDHLAEGTVADNSEDMIAAGRSLVGDRNPAHLQPQTRPRGDRHHSRTRPESLARGAQHGRRTHPERTARGSDAGGARLDEASVQAIRTASAAGESYEAIALRMGVSKSAIAKIITRRTWRHLP